MKKLCPVCHGTGSVKIKRDTPEKVLGLFTTNKTINAKQVCVYCLGKGKIKE